MLLKDDKCLTNSNLADLSMTIEIHLASGPKLHRKLIFCDYCNPTDPNTSCNQPFNPPQCRYYTGHSHPDGGKISQVFFLQCHLFFRTMTYRLNFSRLLTLYLIFWVLLLNCSILQAITVHHRVLQCNVCNLTDVVIYSVHFCYTKPPQSPQIHYLWFCIADGVLMRWPKAIIHDSSGLTLTALFKILVEDVVLSKFAEHKC